jgi:hypothetical protein
MNGSPASPSVQSAHQFCLKPLDDEGVILSDADRHLRKESTRLFSNDKISLEVLRVDATASGNPLKESRFVSANVTSETRGSDYHLRRRATEQFSKGDFYSNTTQLEVINRAGWIKPLNGYIYVRRAPFTVAKLIALSFIKQFHSWSQFQITHEGFIRLLHVYPVSSNFLYFVHAFGQKTADVDTNIGGYSQGECVITEDVGCRTAHGAARTGQLR